MPAARAFCIIMGILLAGCGSQLDLAEPIGTPPTPLHIGDVIEYIAGDLIFTMEIGEPVSYDVLGRMGGIGLPLYFSTSGSDGWHTVLVDLGTFTQVSHTYPCALAATGMEKSCFLQPISFEEQGSPPPLLLFYGHDGRLSQPYTLSQGIYSNFWQSEPAPRHPEYGGCNWWSPVNSHSAPLTIQPPILTTLHARFLICEHESVPILIEPMSAPVTFSLHSRTVGDRPIPSTPATAASPLDLKAVSMRFEYPLPPTGSEDVGVIGIVAAYDHARTFDLGFRQFLEAHPHAVLHSTAEMPVMQFEGPAISPILVSGSETERRFDFVESNSTASYRLVLRQTEAEGHPVLVVSESRSDQRQAQDFQMAGDHVLLSEGLVWGEFLFETPLTGVDVKATVEPLSSPAIPLTDRWHYVFRFDGATFNSGGMNSVSWPYEIVMDSRTGDFLRVVGPPGFEEKVLGFKSISQADKQQAGS